MEEASIVERIQALYPDATVDLEGADCNFQVFVVSAAFAGKTTLQRQRSILDLFKEDLATGRLHALSIKARTPAEQAGSGGLVQIQPSRS